MIDAFALLAGLTMVGFVWLVVAWGVWASRP